MNSPNQMSYRLALAALALSLLPAQKSLAIGTVNPRYKGTGEAILAATAPLRNSIASTMKHGGLPVKQVMISSEEKVVADSIFKAELEDSTELYFKKASGGRMEFLGTLTATKNPIYKTAVQKSAENPNAVFIDLEAKRTLVEIPGKKVTPIGLDTTLANVGSQEIRTVPQGVSGSSNSTTAWVSNDTRLEIQVEGKVEMAYPQLNAQGEVTGARVVYRGQANQLLEKTFPILKEQRKVEIKIGKEESNRLQRELAVSKKALNDLNARRIAIETKRDEVSGNTPAHYKGIIQEIEATEFEIQRINRELSASSGATKEIQTKNFYSVGKADRAKGVSSKILTVMEEKEVTTTAQQVQSVQ